MRVLQWCKFPMQMSMWIVFCIVMLCCIVVLHVVNDLSVAQDFKILQVPVEGLVKDVLLRKYPVVIEPPGSFNDVVKRCQDGGFFKTVGPTKHVDKMSHVVVFHDNVVLHCTTDCIVVLTHPTLDAEMSVKLYNDHYLVLPRKWGYSSDEDLEVSEIESPINIGIRTLQYVL